MSFVPSQRTKITAEETHFLSAPTEIFSNRLGAVINFIVDNVVPYPVGSVVSSLLSEAQFQAILGAGWILSDGRDVTGSSFQTLVGLFTAPDLRGVYLRTKDYAAGRSPSIGDPAVGTFQPTNLQPHTHGSSVVGLENTHGAEWKPPDRNDGSPGFEIFPPFFDAIPTFMTVVIHSAGDSETRPKSMIVNYFLRIN